MGLVDIKFRNTTYTLTSNDEAKVTVLAEKFSARVDSIAANLNNATDNKLALIAGLMLEDELEKLQGELAEGDRGMSEEEAAAAMGGTLDQISQYIEDLANRIEKK